MNDSLLEAKYRASGAPCDYCLQPFAPESGIHGVLRWDRRDPEGSQKKMLICDRCKARLTKAGVL